MTNDEIEAENGRYTRAFFVLPLSSGWIAVLNARREIFGFAESWESAKLLGEGVIENEQRPRQGPIPVQIPHYELDL